MRPHWCVPSGWWQSYRLVSEVGDTESQQWKLKGHMYFNDFNVKCKNSAVTL